MNMKKKLLASLMMIVMVLSLAACGTKTPTASGDAVKAVIDKMSAAEVNGMSMVFEMSMDDENVGIKLDMSGDDTNGIVTIDAKMNIEGMKLDNYVRLSDCVIIDDAFYVNVKAVFDFLAELDPQYAILASYIDLPGDYVKLTLDDLTELYSDVLGVDIDFTELMEASLSAEETDPAYTDAITDVVCRFLDELASKEGSGLTVSGDKISLAIDEKSAEAFMKALASIDVEEYCMQYAEAMDKIEGGVDYTAAMQKEVKGLNDAIKEASEDMGKLDADEKVNIAVSLGVEGKKNVVTMSVSAKDKYEDVKMSFSVTTSPDKSKAVSTPDSVMTYDEFMEVFGY